MVEIVTKQATIRCFDLWNSGTGLNNAAPTGWSDFSFDDSSWPHSANPQFLKGTEFPTSAGGMYSYASSPLEFDFISDPPLPIVLELQPEAVWPQSTPRDLNQIAAFRLHFTISETVTTASRVIYEAHGGGLGPSLQSVHLNGVEIFIGDFGSTDPFWYRDYVRDNIRVGDNVLAWLAVPATQGHEFPANIGGLPSGSWHAGAWCGLEMKFTSGRGRSFGMVIG